MRHKKWWKSTVIMVEAVLNDIVILKIFHTYLISFVWSWKPCRKVNNVKLGARKNRMFLQPCIKVNNLHALKHPNSKLN